MGKKIPLPPRRHGLVAKVLQLLWDEVRQTLYRGFAPGPHWGTSVPRPPLPPRFSRSAYGPEFTHKAVKYMDCIRQVAGKEKKKENATQPKITF